MRFAQALARIGDRIITFLASVLVLCMLLYGGYSIWDMWNTSQGAFISSELLKSKPVVDDMGNEDTSSLYDLKQINDDVRGWLTIDGTNIDYPVLQGEDDMEYVNKDIYGDFSLSGAIFLSAVNAGDFTDRYNIIYGHNVDGGAMFADIFRFQDQEFFDTHKTGRIYGFDRVYELEIFAVVSVNAYDDIFYRYQREYKSPEEMQELIDYYPGTAVRSRDVGLTAQDRIFALSTCTSASTYGRLLLLCRVIPTEAG